MKAMKKMLAGLLVLVMALSLAACGGKEEEKKTLIMATNAEFPPYEYHEGDEIVGIDGGLIRAEIKAEQRTACEPKIRVALFHGIPKAGKLETVVQKAVELGAAGIVPFRADRSVARIPDGSKGEQKIARLNKIAREAAKQCGRGVVPEVAAPVSIDGMIDMIKNLDMAVMLYEELGHAGEKNLKSVLSRPAESIGVVIGPEGGFSAAEAERLTALPNVYAAGLGPRILRTETAGIAALAVIMYEKNEI